MECRVGGWVGMGNELYHAGSQWVWVGEDVAFGVGVLGL